MHQYAPISSALTPSIAAMLVLLLLERLRERLTRIHSSMKYVVWLAMFFAGASVIGGIASTPLVSSLSISLEQLFIGMGKTAGAWGGNLFVIAVVLSLCVLLLKLYQNDHKVKWLLLFGLMVGVATVLIPVLATPLRWWADEVVLRVWNTFAFTTDYILKLSVKET